mgnify:CR=1 FL=1
MSLARALSRFTRFSLGLETPLERRNMLNATIEGSLVVAGVQIVVAFVGVYLLALGGDATQLSLVNSLPFLFNALSLIIVTQSRGTPRQILGYAVRAGVAHRLVLALLPLAPFWGMWAPWWVIIVYSLASAALMLSSAYWTATVSDMFPAHIRGRVFGVRQMFTGLSAFVATSLAGKLLDLIAFPYNYAAAFGAAVAVAGWGTFFLTRLVPAGEADKEEAAPPSLREFVGTEASRALWKVAVPVGVFNIGFFMLNPVINLYFVEVLELSNAQIGLLSAVFVIAQTIGSWLWGALADRHGNHTVTIAATLGLAVQAIGYWLSPSLYYLIFVQAVGGFCFAGFLLATFNTVIGIGDRQQKTLVVSSYHFIGNMASFLAPFLGTWAYTGPGLVAAFLLAGLLRAVSAALLLQGRPARRQGVPGEHHRGIATGRRAPRGPGFGRAERVRFLSLKILGTMAFRSVSSNTRERRPEFRCHTIGGT